MDITTNNQKRVLIAKSDMDAHDRAVRFVIEILKGDGMEVIFIRYRVPQEVPLVAMQEGVDVIILTFYSPGALHETSIVMQGLKDKNMSGITMIVGGIISPQDTAKLQQKGVAVFGPGRPVEEIVEYIRSRPFKNEAPT